MTFQEIIDEVRYDLGDFNKPYKWQEVELVRHANDAIKTICRDAKVLLDPSTTATSRITTVAPVVLVYTLDYALSALVIDVIDVTLVASSTDYRTLAKTNYATVSQSAGWRSDTACKPTEYLLDYKPGYITFHPAPDAVYTVNLHVVRYPITAFNQTSTFASQTPEIDAAYHPALVDGILAKAYLKSGPETFDQKKAMMHMQMFRNAIASMKKERNLYWGRDNERSAGPHPGFI